MISIDKQKCKILIIGISAIYFFYFLNSVIQQRLMKVPYINTETSKEEYFTSSNVFNLFPSLVAWGIGYVYNNFCRKDQKTVQVPKKSWIKSAVLIVISTTAMMKAIYLTNYPLVTLFKSCNLLSVVCVGIFCSRVKDKNQKLKKNQLVIGCVVTAGVLLYHFGSERLNDKQDKTGYGVYLGIALLLLSLVCDGLIPDFQAEIKTKYKPSALEMFQHINKWKTYLALIYSIATFELIPLLSFMYTYPLSFFHVMATSITGSVGQIFVYWLINRFRQHIVPFIITTRKIFTVIISIIYFGHPVTIYQILGIIIVMVTVIYQFMRELTATKQNQQPQPKEAQKSQVELSEQIKSFCGAPHEDLESVKVLKETEVDGNKKQNSQEEIKT